MKKPISIKFFLSSASLAWALIGNFSLQSSHAQDEFTPAKNTDLVTASPDNAPTASSLPPDVDTDSPLAQVIRLVQAGVGQGVILSYIGNSMNSFSLNADQIIYLNDLGVPTEVVNAMQQRDQQLQQMGVTTGAAAAPPPEATETPTTQPAEVTVNYFYDTLAPYGGWVNVEGYGWCWRPTIVAYNTGWQPYCDNGHWVYTDCGWYWVSGYSWGWAAFHYGRWFQIPRYGWCWWPDTTWSPSWVCWRHDRDHCGWAPLPPHAVYQSGVGFVYQGRAISAGFSFGLSANAFTFVATRDFCDPHPRRHRVEAGEVTRFFNQTTVINNINFDSHHQGIVNAGIPPHDITAVTRREIHPVTIQAGNGSGAWGARREQFEHNGNTLIVDRPHFVGTPVLSFPGGTAPTIQPGQNKFQPVVHGNGNNAPSHTVNPGQNNSPHQDFNQNPYQHFNQTPPRMPQTQQPGVPRVNTPNPRTPDNNVVPALPRNNPAWPAQNQKPNYNYNNSGNGVSTPGAQGSGQQPPHTTTDHVQSHGTVVGGQPFSSPSNANHYSPPVGRQQNNDAPPADESRYHNQNSNQSSSSRQVVQPHSSSQSSSSSSPSSGKPGQNQNNSQGGH